MARWRLLNPHYLNVPGTEWEYVEISRATGKQARVRFPVGLFLNPQDPADHNYPGEIIVADKKSSYKNDIIFVGNPTPDMEPVDEEAEKISGEWRPKWIKPMSEEALPGYGDYSQSLFSKFEKELTNAIKSAGGVPKGAENVSVKASEFDELKRQVAELARQNAELLAKVKRPVGRPRKVLAGE